MSVSGRMIWRTPIIEGNQRIQLDKDQAVTVGQPCSTPARAP